MNDLETHKRRQLHWLLGLSLSFVAAASLVPSLVRAQQQFVLIDSTFTATAQNTDKSQYPLAPLPAAPASWRTPVDYTGGTMYVRYEVLEKPSNLATYGNVCFETAMTLTCEPYPPMYTDKGVYMHSAKISLFWQYDVFDWTKKLERVYVVLKDDKQTIVQGNAQFYPTKLHVTVTIVPPGKTYVMPPVTPTMDEDDAGRPVAPPVTRDAGVRDAGAKDAGPAVPPNAGQSAPAAGRGVAGMAGTGRGLASAGSSGMGALQPTDAGVQYNVKDYIDPGASCSLLAVPAAKRSLVPVCMLGVLIARGLRSRRRRRPVQRN